MSRILINEYLNELDRLTKISGTLTEGVISEAFKDLLKAWARQNNLTFVSQYEFESSQKTRIRPDGTILHDLRVPLGYWEAKDSMDDLGVEIERKFRRGYPQDNIIFENSATAVLVQNRAEVLRCSMQDTDKLYRLLELFFGYEHAEIAEFRKAVQQFRADLPHVLGALRDKISEAYQTNPGFGQAAAKFLQHVKETVNPTLGEADVREMLIQHILTEEIFAHVFNEGDFHRDNNIARELYALESAFFTGALKKDTLKGLERYYAAIRANAAQITSHHEKQNFLKVIYENFYKVYNPKAADRLGVVYTPGEIVRFMAEGADWLCRKHFGRGLIDRDVEILDPAAGTGTFVCELIEQFRGQPEKLAYKYKNELHANEVAILPYYVANLNIEATYAVVTGQFAEFPNLCFVDTLDNVAGLGIRAGHQPDLFGAMSEENIERVKRQNRRKISVIIGNPPYNANQQNENENNKNRTYPRIDERIKDTYIARSTAQKTKLYDMYARFFRWASDRLHDDGVLALISNRSFIDSRTFDGFRRCVADEFNEIYVVDLGGDVRANPKISGTKHNVFGIQTGVAISFMVKRHKQQGCKIFYARRPEFDTAEDKLAFLASNKASAISYQRVEPDKNANWINLTENDWDDLIPVADKKTKAAKTKGQEKAIFRQLSFGIATNRDDWLYDRNRDFMYRKLHHFIDAYEKARKSWHAMGDKSAPVDALAKSIKWTAELQNYAKRNVPFSFEEGAVRVAQYRPFVQFLVYYWPMIVHRTYQQETIFPHDQPKLQNLYIALTDPTAQKPWMVLAGNLLPDLHLVGAAAGAVCLPRYRYTKSGEKIDNITDWALKTFREAYARSTGSPPPCGEGAGAGVASFHQDSSPTPALRADPPHKGEGSMAISKDDIFHYVYGVLHDPLYRETYAINLKREFPRIPFYPDFWQWAQWGRRLMDLHIHYEAVEPWPLARLDVADDKAGAAGMAPRTILRADRDHGIIVLDSETQLSGVPAQAWDYRLGNRSGLDWILDQYKEKTPRDPTIREKFNTYRFADYKDKAIDLLMRVTRVSVETMGIVAAMKDAKR